MNTKHLISSVITIILLWTTVYVLQQNTMLYFPNYVYLVIGILGSLSFIFGEWISRAINERPALYVNRFMMSFLMKMMSFLILLGTYLYLYSENKVNVAISLFVCYLIFNVHMIVFLKKSEKKFKAQNTPSKKSKL